jgi:hypothetical protein
VDRMGHARAVRERFPAGRMKAKIHSLAPALSTPRGRTTPEMHRSK